MTAQLDLRGAWGPTAACMQGAALHVSGWLAAAGRPAFDRCLGATAGSGESCRVCSQPALGRTCGCRLRSARCLRLPSAPCRPALIHGHGAVPFDKHPPLPSRSRDGCSRVRRRKQRPAIGAQPAVHAEPRHRLCVAQGPAPHAPFRAVNTPAAQGFLPSDNTSFGFGELRPSICTSILRLRELTPSNCTPASSWGTTCEPSNHQPAANGMGEVHTCRAAQQHPCQRQQERLMSSRARLAGSGAASGQEDAPK